MPNIKSAKKALRSSLRKRQHNNYWKNRIHEATKALEEALKTDKSETDILNKKLSVLQKALDKAAKNNVLHKNKANRLKSRYANKIAALTEGNKTKDTKDKKDTKKSK